MFDTHAHLTDETFNSDLDFVVHNFKANNGVGLLDVGHDPATNLQVIENQRKYDTESDFRYLISFGLHPCYFTEGRYDSSATSVKRLRNELEALNNLYSENQDKVSAVGETGLDYFHFDRMGLDRNSDTAQVSIELQKSSFREHISIAKKYALPMTIHTRDSGENSQCTEDALKILTEEASNSIKACIHSYTGEMKFLKDFLNLEYYVSFNGILTYKSAENVRKLAYETPIELMLLETDAPFLPVDSVRKSKSLSRRYGQPSQVLEIATTIAEIKDITIEKVLEQTTSNAYNFFNLEN